MGVIAKRPVANAIWRTSWVPADDYSRPYWDRLRKLDFEFLRKPEEAFATALQFTISVPGVHTAIVGTTNPQRIAENVRLASAGPLSDNQFSAIRRRWDEVATPTWVGER